MIPQASKPTDDALSLWQEVAPTRQVNPCLEGEVRTDVVVIGGGFTGLSAALHLAQSGVKVCLVEGKTIGWGGSGRNNGQVIPVLAGCEPSDLEAHFGEAGERFVHLIRDSADVLFKLAEKENIDCEAEQTGWFQPAHSPDHTCISEKRVEEWAKRGAPCELLDGRETARLLGSKNWYGGMLNPTGGHINPLMFAHGLALACQQAGVTVFENSPVNGVKRVGNNWVVSGAKGQIKCNAVLMATNAYSHELSHELEPQVARSVIPVTSWQLATKPIFEALRKEIIPNREAISDTRGDLQFFRYDARNQLVSGAALMLPYNAGVRLDSLISGRLAKAFPELGKPEFTHIWSGFVGITPDRFPHFHRIGQNYYAAIGFNGRGVALSISVGREMAKLINGGNVKDLALPLSPVKRVPFYAVARRVSRSGLAYYRWRDRQKPKL
jgi:glycine/D-amino acid oxidase-like deaminating enzyme